MSLRPNLRHDIYLIGDVDVQICGNKLPSKMQVLKVFFYNMREVKMGKEESAKLVIREVKIFWDKARLPIQKEDRCKNKLLLLYDTWDTLGKHKTRESNKEKEQRFLEESKDLFDIAHGNVMTDPAVGKDCREFLTDQRKPGRVGYINQIESHYDKLEQEQERRRQILAARVERSEGEKTLIDNFVEFTASDESFSQSLSQKSVGAYSGTSLEPEDQTESTPSAPKKSRGNINIFSNDKVVAALDMCKVSDRFAVHLVAAIAEALGVDLQTLVLNRSSIRNYRQKVREARALNTKQIFQNIELNALILHWDGKLLYDILQREVVDRLPVVVSNGEVQKLLGVPKLENGKGITQAHAIFDVLEDWALSANVKALCCDTTASNLGNKNGAATFLERLLEKDILLFPCRHHIFELILRAAFESKLPGTTGPDVALFKKFKNDWKELELTSFRSGIQDERVRRVVGPDDINRIEFFVKDILKSKQPRDDYKELLDLTLVFLGCVSPEQVKFRYPGAFHHARWMAKAIYTLKIFLFRHHFSMTREELSGIRETCIFIVMVYLETWFTAPVAAAAPNHDLQLLKKLHNYKTIDKAISLATTKKFSNHLWYLNPECMALSFFDENISDDVKRKMITGLKPYEEVDDFYLKRVQINLKRIDGFMEREIDEFVTPQTRNFFTRFEIDEEFLKVDPSDWHQSEEFQKGVAIVTKLKLVNDIAERAVHLFSEYNKILTKDEDQKQFVLQLVTEYHNRFSDSKKSTVMQKF